MNNKLTWNLLLLLLTFSGTSLAQTAPTNVLILWDNLGSHVTAVQTTLQNAGMNVYVSPISESLFDGTSPSLSGVDVIVHFNQTTFNQEMPVAGQLAIKDFVENQRGGYIHSEFMTYATRNLGMYQSMQDLVLFDRSSTLTSFGTITYTKVAAQASHDVCSTLPASYSFTHLALNVGPLHAFATDPATVIFTDNLGSAAVAVRKFGNGRILGFNHGPFADMTDLNLKQLWINAIEWANVPPPPCYTNTWTGALNANWHQPGNWSCLMVPNDTMDVVIEDVVNDPVLNNLSAPIIVGLTIKTGATLKLSSPAVLSITGDFDCDGTVFGAGSIEFSGTGVQRILAPVEIGGFIGVNIGAVLQTNNNLTLLPSASLLHGVGTAGGGGDVVGNVKVKKNGYSLSYAFNIFGSPVSGQSVSLLGSQVWDYDEANNDLLDFRNDWQVSSGLIQPGIGYAARSAGQILFIGPPGNGNYIVPVTHSSSTKPSEDGWNCIGNPYPSSLNISQFLAGNVGEIDGAVYFWDDPLTGPGHFTHGDYAVRNLAGAVAGGGHTTPGTFVPSGQGFFVHKTNVGSGNVTFTNSMRRMINNQFFKEGSDEIQRIKLSAKNANGLYNETLIAFSDLATDDFDELYDARKLSGNDLISFYSELHETPLAIQTLAIGYMEKEVPLTIETNEGGQFIIEMIEHENLPETVEVFLEDRQNAIFIDLFKDRMYAFETQSESAVIVDRFYLQVREKETTSSVEDGITNGEVEILQNNGTLKIKSTQPLWGALELYNTLGQSMVSRKLSGETEVSFQIDRSQAILIVALYTSSQNIIQKVIMN